MRSYPHYSEKTQIIKGFSVEHDFPELGKQHMEINARRIVSAPENPPLILLAITVQVKP